MIILKCCELTQIEWKLSFSNFPHNHNKTKIILSIEKPCIQNRFYKHHWPMQIHCLHNTLHAQSLSKTYKWTKLHLWQYIRSQYIQFSVSAKQSISRNTCRLTVCSSIFSYERKLISVRRKFWHDFPIKKKVACSKLHVSPFRIDIFNSLALYLCILENTACTCTRFRLCLRFSFCFARMRIKVCVFFFSICECV